MSDQSVGTSRRRAYIRASAAAGAAILSGCSSVRRLVDPPRPADAPSGAQNWPEYRYDPGNTGHHPHATVPTEEVEIAWHHSTDYPVYSMPTVVDGVVYYGTQLGYHVAANARTGRVLWREKTAEVTIPQNGSAVTRRDVVFMGNGDLDARAVETGEKLWAFWGYRDGDEKGYVLGSPKLVDGVLYLTVWDNVFAFDPDDRETLWRFRTRGDAHSTPAVADGTVYAVDETGSVYAVDAATGELEWERRFGVGYETESSVESPVASSGAVYVSGADGRFYALEASDGSTRWSLAGHFDPPAVGDSSVFVAGSSMLALDPASGDVQWEFEPRAMGRQVNGATYASGTVLCTCNCGEALALSAETGEVRWRSSLVDAARFDGPAVAGSMVYFNGGDGVYALRGV